MVKKFNLNLIGIAALSATLHAAALGADLLINEYNAVGTDEILGNDNNDLRLGVIEGNGGNWIELAVVRDHLDIRGWQLRWAEENDDGVEQAIVWDPERPAWNQGVIRFTNHDAWSDLRAGTILTIGELETIEAADGASVVSGTDLSFDPANEDWWIHVWSFDETLIMTETNVEGDGPGNFSVGDDDWEGTLVDQDENVVGFVVGEAYFDEGVNNEEVGKLEVDPSQETALEDYNDGSSSTFGLPNIWSAGTVTQDFSQLRSWFPEDPGDAFEIAMELNRDNPGAPAIQLTWPSAPGQTFHVESKSRLDESGWTTLDTVAANADSIEWIDPQGLQEAVRFYRVRRE